MSTHSVQVAGIAPTTTESQLHDFFTFCGKINSIDHKGSNADIHFEKPSAAKTALMLNGGTLDGATLTVTSEKDYEDGPDASAAGEASHEHHAPAQEDKPRAGIAAEYLAKGYLLSDQVLQRSIELDQKHGISNRFLGYINHIDQKVGQRALGPDQTLSGKVQATFNSSLEQAKAVDSQKGYSKSAFDYYGKMLSSPFGQKVYSFYTTTSKQVLDIHEEAKRIATHHKGTAGAPPAAPASEPAPTATA